MSGCESRLQHDVSHCISKALVRRAKGTGRAIALEVLKGIGGRTRFKRTMRRRLGGWAFHQLGLYVKYKTERAGVPVVEVDPRNTSRECPRCGHAERANRRTQAVFQCNAESAATPATPTVWRRRTSAVGARVSSLEVAKKTASSRSRPEYCGCYGAVDSILI